MATMDPSEIEGATKRLQAALDSLETAMERRTEVDRGQAALAGQLQAFEADRSRLAAELDVTAARSRALETTNRDIAARLDEAIDTIRTVIAANDHQDDPAGDDAHR
jgi:septal ring factor EnvC (AmiA/AmiB activator)